MPGEGYCTYGVVQGTVAGMSPINCVPTGFLLTLLIVLPQVPLGVATARGQGGGVRHQGRGWVLDEYVDEDF